MGFLIHSVEFGRPDHRIVACRPNYALISRHPGHGPIANRAASIAQRDMVLAVRDRVAMLGSQ
jgi:hypothetical protein